MGDYRNRANKRMSRKQFEALIKGEWNTLQNDRYRKNGKFTTYVKAQFKFLSDGENTIKTKTWNELAIALELAWSRT